MKCSSYFALPSGMRKLFIISFIVSFVVILYACRKDNSKTTFTPTPYALQYPKYVDSQNVNPIISANNPLTIEGVALGRKLFYEKMLSNNMSMNCATCHKQENGFSDPRNFSLGTDNAIGNRNSMGLINLAWNNSFFWDGRRGSLEDQVHDPVTNPIEMENTWPVVMQKLQNSNVYPDLFKKAFGTSTIDSTLVQKAISQFERTLISYGSRFDQFYYQGKFYALNQQELDGFTVFAGFGHCTSCHSGVLMTDHMFRNNGLDVTPKDSGFAKVTHSAGDYGKFKVPTLRNINLTAPYMHDGRFTSLVDVVDYYSDNINATSPNLDSILIPFSTGFHLSYTQKSNLVAFLKALTDSSMVSNQNFSEPK